MTLGPRRVASRLTFIPVLPALSALALALSAAGPAQAQSDAEPKKAEGGLERAQKQADAVFHWIKLNADKGASRQAAPTPAPAPSPAARKPAPAPAPAAAANRAAAPTAQAAAANPPPSALQAAAPAPTPDAVVAEPPPTVLLASAAPMPAPDAPLAIAREVSAAPQADPEVPLQLLSRVQPQIPRQWQGALRTGFAQVQFTVAPDGTVTKAQAVKVSNARLGGAAVDAVRQWKFAPIPTARDAAVEVVFNNTD